MKNIVVKNCMECKHDKTCNTYYGSQACKPEKKERKNNEMVN